MEKLKALIRLEESLAKLPSVGRRSAERMAYAMLNMDDDDLAEFSDAIKSLKQSIHVCPICGFLAIQSVTTESLEITEVSTGTSKVSITWTESMGESSISSTFSTPICSTEPLPQWH